MMPTSTFDYTAHAELLATVQPATYAAIASGRDWAADPAVVQAVLAREVSWGVYAIGGGGSLAVCPSCLPAVTQGSGAPDLRVPPGDEECSMCGAMS